MAKNPYQGDDTDYFSAVRDKEGNVKQTGLPKSATPKKKNRIVTKEELKKSGFTNLRDFLNAERGLRRRVKKDSEGKTASGMSREARGVRDDSLSDKDRERARLDSAREQSQAGRYGTMKAGGTVKMKSGGSVSRRADGCAKKGKTKGRMI